MTRIVAVIMMKVMRMIMIKKLLNWNLTKEPDVKLIAPLEQTWRRDQRNFCTTKEILVKILLQYLQYTSITRDTRIQGRRQLLFNGIADGVALQLQGWQTSFAIHTFFAQIYLLTDPLSVIADYI